MYRRQLFRVLIILLCMGIGVVQAQTLPPSPNPPYSGSYRDRGFKTKIQGSEARKRASRALDEMFSGDFRRIEQHLKGNDFVVDLYSIYPNAGLTEDELMVARAWELYFNGEPGDLRRAYDITWSVWEDGTLLNGPKIRAKKNARLLSTLIFWRLQVFPLASKFGKGTVGYPTGPWWDVQAGSAQPATPFGGRYFSGVLSDLGVGEFSLPWTSWTPDSGELEKYSCEPRGVQPCAWVWYYGSPVELEKLGPSRSTHTLVIRAGITDRVEEIHFSPGQIVSQGDLLYEIDTRTYGQRIMAVVDARFPVIDAERDYSRAVKEFDYAVRQFESGTGDNAEVERTRSNMERAKAKLLEAKRKLQKVSEGVRNTEVRAPIAGRMGKSFVEVGQLVQAGDPLTSIGHGQRGSFSRRFAGALTITDKNSGRGEKADYWLVYRDLEGPPLPLLGLGKTIPSIDKIDRFAADFCVGRLGELGRPNPLRAQMEAAWYHCRGITPLAAAWCRWADIESKVTDEIKRSLIHDFAWHWQRVEEFQLGSSQEYKMLAFKNTEAIPEVVWAVTTWTDSPWSYRWQHYHFVVARSDEHRYLASYRLVSDPVSTERDRQRLYQLERVQGNKVTIMDVYTKLPDYDELKRKVIRFIDPEHHGQAFVR